MTWLYRIGFLALLIAGVAWFHHVRTNRPNRVDAATLEQRLILGNGTELETLDPHLATGHPEHMVLTTLFEGLVAPGENNPDEPGPGAATHWETTDFIHWKFYLQKEARWSDGTPVTAQDFLYAYQRILSPDLAADYASMLYPLKNAEAFNKGEIKDFGEVGVTAPDPHTLELVLDGPAPYLPGMLKHYAWFPVPKHVIENFGTMTQRESRWTRQGNLVGNGPFKLKTRIFTHSLTVEPNPHYWDAAKVKLKEIQFLPIASAVTEERAFRDGQLHATYTMPLSLIPTYRDNHPDVYHEDPLLAVYFYRINTTKKPFDDKRVRQALALAIDRESLIRNVLRAGQKPGTGLVPYGESMKYDAPKRVTFDLEKARRLLAEAGFPDGKDFPPFEVLINTNEAHLIIAEALQEMWRKNLNIPVSILNQDWGVYLDSQKTMKYQVCRAGWVADYPDPYTFLNIWRTGDGNNNTGWGNPQYDKLMLESTREGDAKKRMEILKEAETLFLEEMPVIPIYWYSHTTLQRPEVKGWLPSVQDHRSYKTFYLEAPVKSGAP